MGGSSSTKPGRFYKHTFLRVRERQGNAPNRAVRGRHRFVSQDADEATWW